ncbi:MAG: Nramp family divalent metal transporter [Planctomycetes bacterium]|nr:Nramp family divalent metal transporter [Planctomycetota bacterium]
MGYPTKKWLSILGPGVLVAATGVGAGDLATAAFTGSRLGLACLWAVVLGAGIKYLLNEGLARWQLVTGDTLLEGVVAHLGRSVVWIFFAYLLAWSFLVAAVLMSACGAAAHAIWPLFHSAQQDKIAYGVLHSGAALVLIKVGGFRLFAKTMGICIAAMFAVVIGTALALAPPWQEVAMGILVPSLPQWRGEGLAWTIGLMGGVGGTVTILCYGYWIREEGRESVRALGACRIDLAVAYAMTGLFGLAMVFIGSELPPAPGKGVTLIANLADVLRTQLGALGPAARWAFLIGAWAAVFSSLLGVWQSVPYLFADLWPQMKGTRPDRKGTSQTNKTKSALYASSLLLLATLPISGLVLIEFTQLVKWYSVTGALFIPMLALALLILNGQSTWVTKPYRNSPLTTLLLVGTLLFFLFAGWLVLRSRF